MGIVTLLVEVLTRIKPTESLRLVKREARNEPDPKPQVILRPKNYIHDARVRKQTCKVLIDTTRSTYGDRQEHDGIRPLFSMMTLFFLIMS
jgi:hypothetical protein